MTVLRAMRAEALRLRVDPVLLSCLALALLPTVAIVASLPDDIASPGLADALQRPLRTALLANVAIIAAGFGAVRTAAAYAGGVVGRDTLILGVVLPLWMRVVSSAGGAALVALVAGASAWVGTSAIRGIDVFDTGALGQVVLMGAGAGVWGAAIGALVRAPLTVLPVIIVSLSPAMLLPSFLPDAVMLLPLGSALLAVGNPIVDASVEHWWGIVIALLWLAAALGTSFVFHRRRGLLP